MQFVYEVPRHLLPHIEHCTEKELHRAITVVLELAVRHQLIYFPDTSLERDVSWIKQSLSDIKQELRVNDSSLRGLVNALSQNMDKLTLKIEALSAETPQSREVDNLLDEDVDISIGLSKEELTDEELDEEYIRLFNLV